MVQMQLLMWMWKELRQEHDRVLEVLQEQDLSTSLQHLIGEGVAQKYRVVLSSECIAFLLGHRIV